MRHLLLMVLLASNVTPMAGISHVATPTYAESVMAHPDGEDRPTFTTARGSIKATVVTAWDTLPIHDQIEVQVAWSQTTPPGPKSSISPSTHITCYHAF